MECINFRQIKLLVIIYLLIVILILKSSSWASMSLNESFQNALRSHQTDGLSQARMVGAKGLSKQAYADFWPSFNLKANYFKQENVDVQSNLALNLTYSLYRGGRDQLEYQVATMSENIYDNQKYTDRLNLYMEVVNAYYSYFLSWNDFNNLELLFKLSQERLQEIRSRVRIGKARKGEALQAEAQLAAVNAQKINGRGLLNEGQARYLILTGLDKNPPSEKILKEFFNDDLEKLATPKEMTLEHYINFSLSANEMKAKKISLLQIEKNLELAQRAHLPSLDVQTNAYFHRSGVSTLLQKTDWDFTLTLTLPLFEGGRSEAKIKEAMAKKREAILLVDDYQTLLKIRVAEKYQNFIRLKDQIKAYQFAEKSARESYDVALKDFRLGLISNLDLLTSLNLYLDSKRNAEKIKIQALMGFKILEATAGIMP